MNNWLGFILCITYVFSLIGLAEWLRRRRGYGNDFTRKIIHIGVGMLSWVLPFLFTNPWPFIAACLLFAVLNFLDWRYGFFRAMASSNPQNLGTVYFPLAAAAVAYVFWDTPPLMVAALMPLTLGDGLAPVVGRYFGKRTYRVGTHSRTVEGSIAFLIATTIGVWLALWIMPGMPVLTMLDAVLPAIVIGFATMLVEAVSMWGLDNLTVTATAMVILSLWSF